VEAGVGIEPAYAELQSAAASGKFLLIINLLSTFLAVQFRVILGKGAHYKSITCKIILAVFIIAFASSQSYADSSEQPPQCRATLDQDFTITIPNAFGFGLKLRYIGKFTWAFQETIPNPLKLGCSAGEYDGDILTIRDLREGKRSWYVQLQYGGYNKWRLHFAELRVGN